MVINKIAQTHWPRNYFNTPDSLPFHLSLLRVEGMRMKGRRKEIKIRKKKGRKGRLQYLLRPVAYRPAKISCVGEQGVHELIREVEKYILNQSGHYADILLFTNQILVGIIFCADSDCPSWFVELSWFQEIMFTSIIHNTCYQIIFLYQYFYITEFTMLIHIVWQTMQLGKEVSLPCDFSRFCVTHWDIDWYRNFTYFILTHKFLTINILRKKNLL